MLFSATQSETTEALIKSAMKEEIQIINTNEDNDRATVEGLKQGYVKNNMNKIKNINMNKKIL